VLHLPGVFAECNTEEDQKTHTYENVFLLYELGVFSVLIQLLSMEIEYVQTAALSLFSAEWNIKP